MIFEVRIYIVHFTEDAKNFKSWINWKSHKIFMHPLSLVWKKNRVTTQHFCILETYSLMHYQKQDLGLWQLNGHNSQIFTTGFDVTNNKT